MKEYFNSRNVLIVLGLLFSGITFFGSKIFYTKSKIFSEYENAIDKISVANDLRFNTQIVTQYTNDSLTGIDTRIKEYGVFLILARKNPHECYIIKAIELKRSVLSDIARFTKFENLKQSEELPNMYLIYSNYLNTERKMVDLIHKFYIAVEAKKDKNNNEIYGEMESTFFELEALNEKILSITQLTLPNIQQQKKYSSVLSDKFSRKMFGLNTFIDIYIIGILICLISWVTVFIYAIKYGTFKKSD